MKKYYLSLIITVLMASFIYSLKAEAVTNCPTPTSIIKMATLAPDGSSFHKGLTDWKNAIKTATGGCVEIQIIGGGAAGEEPDYVRKMRTGQVQAAALTGAGLGMIQPEIRVLELPFLFRNTSQIDLVYSKMKPYFEKKLDEKGFVLLGWAEIGWVKVFSNKPIAKKSDIQGLKLWLYQGDPVGAAMFEVMKVVPVPAPVTDVLTALQTGNIDGCYNTPLGAIAMQWHTKAKYMTDINLVNGSGGIVISKDAFSKLSAEHQAILKQVTTTEAQKLVSRTRVENEQSIQAIQSAGIQIVQPDPASLEEFKALGKEVHVKLAGQLFPQSLLDQINQMIAQAP